METYYGRVGTKFPGMNRAPVIKNHLRSIDFFRSMIILNNRSKVPDEVLANLISGSQLDLKECPVNNLTFVGLAYKMKEYLGKFANICLCFVFIYSVVYIPSVAWLGLSKAMCIQPPVHECGNI